MAISTVTPSQVVLSIDATPQYLQEQVLPQMGEADWIVIQSAGGSCAFSTPEIRTLVVSDAGVDATRFHQLLSQYVDPVILDPGTPDNIEARFKTLAPSRHRMLLQREQTFAIVFDGGVLGRTDTIKPPGDEVGEILCLQHDFKVQPPYCALCGTICPHATCENNTCRDCGTTGLAL